MIALEEFTTEKTAMALLSAAPAYLHFAFIFTLIVFQAAQAAVLRPEWLGPALVQRLQRLSFITQLAMVLVLASGLLRMYYFGKPPSWYWSNPIMHIKLTLVALLFALNVPALLAFKRWKTQLDAGGGLPTEAELRRAKRWVMISSHVMLLVPIFAVLMARGMHGFGA